jgi:hypothetical protein
MAGPDAEFMTRVQSCDEVPVPQREKYQRNL